MATKPVKPNPVLQFAVVGGLLLGGFGAWTWVSARLKPAHHEPTAPRYPNLSDLLPALPAGRDLDCSDFLGPVWVGTYDPYHLDADHDGIGCEPYP